MIAQSYHHTYGLPVAITRCGNVYGGGDLNWNRIVPGTIRSCLQNERPIIRSDGQFVRDYIYVKEVAHAGLPELIVTESMHERKTTMAQRSDACIALPGGIGTLEELFEAWTWTQLGFQRKPCGLLNVAGYFDGLIQFIEHSVSEGYLDESHRDILIVDTDPDGLLERLERFEPPALPQWLESGGT
jgi:hypothetical protein